MADISQKQILKLQQKLSPQQIQMIKLLELPTLQLEKRVRQEVEENPVLEEQATDEQKNEEGMPKEVSMEDYLKGDETPSYKSYANNHSRDDKVPQAILYEGRSLHEYLMEQLGYRSVSEQEFRIARYIIGNIDEDGYLRLSLESIADDIAFNLGFEESIEDIEAGLRLVQSLEPPGVGARDIRECLMLQIERKGDRNEAQNLAYKILSDYFGEFTKKHFEKIISRLNIDEERFRDAIDEIHRLSPKPGNLYNEGGNLEAPYVIPDFIIEENDGKLSMRLNSYNVPELRINRKYADMIKVASSSKKPSKQDKEALQFVKSKIDSAKWFISAIKQRYDTLMHTMQAIMDYQHEYFLDGNESRLKPMILKDIADITGLDVSTISRVVNSKYAQTGFGVISLKQLFSEAMQTDSGEEVSSYEIKNILSECIGREDKRKPLTDEALMEILNNMGYHIARRTVAKYRELLDIPVARLRKEL